MAELGKNEIDIIFESTYDSMIAVNSSGIVTLFNKAAGRITGLNAKDVLGKPAVDVIPSTRLHIVLEEGVTEIGQEQNLGNIVPPIIDDPAIFREIEVRQYLLQKQCGARSALFLKQQASFSYAKNLSGTQVATVKWQRNFGRPESQLPWSIRPE